MKLIEKYKAIKEDYLRRSLRGKWTFVQQIGIFFLKICGIAIIDRNFKVTWFSFSKAVAVFDVIVSFAYTIWYFSGTIQGFLVVPCLGTLLSVSFFISTF